MSPWIEEALVAVALLAGLAAAVELGFRAGVRATAGSDPLAVSQVGAIQAAILGLLGLLLAFSFAAAGGRFLERQDLITVEANAIGTATLRADLLDEPHRTALINALRDYTHKRLEVSKNLARGIDPQVLAEVEAYHDVIWNAAITGVNAKPATLLGVLPPVNDVIDVHSTRLSAGRKRLPALVMGLLIACSLMAMLVIGYGSGMGGRRRAAFTMALAILIAAGLWITIDLDHPRAGLMQLNDAPLKALKFDRPPAK